MVRIKGEVVAETEISPLFREVRKKPVVVWAVRVLDEFEVDTLEAEAQKGKPGDVLVKGIKGELYPCDYEIFRATYDGNINEVRGA